MKINLQARSWVSMLPHYDLVLMHARRSCRISLGTLIAMVGMRSVCGILGSTTPSSSLLDFRLCLCLVIPRDLSLVTYISCSRRMMLELANEHLYMRGFRSPFVMVLA